MNITIEPISSAALAPLVMVKVGRETAMLTPVEAENLAESLFRAATTSRHESAVAEIMLDNGIPLLQIKDSLEQLREKIEARRIARN